MTKFRCQQCGHRIAMPPRHIGKLVRCPECGGSTHPWPSRSSASPPCPSRTSAARAGRRRRRLPRAGRRPTRCGTAATAGGLSAGWRCRTSGTATWCACPATATSPIPRRASRSSRRPRRPHRAERRDARRHRGARVAAEADLARLGSLSRTRRTPPTRSIASCRCFDRTGTNDAGARKAIGLAGYFLISFVQVISLLANIAIVGLLLLLALYLLYRGSAARDGGSRLATAGSDGEGRPAPERR